MTGYVCHQNADPFLVDKNEIIEVTRHRSHRDVAGSYIQALKFRNLAREN